MSGPEQAGTLPAPFTRSAPGPFLRGGTDLVVQLLLGVESLQVEEILFKQVDIRLQKGLSKSLEIRP